MSIIEQAMKRIFIKRSRDRIEQEMEALRKKNQDLIDKEPPPHKELFRCLNELRKPNQDLDDQEMKALKDARTCPFCGSWALRTTDWADDDGGYIAIECRDCKGCAPADVWNRRERA